MTVAGDGEGTGRGTVWECKVREPTLGTEAAADIKWTGRKGLKICSLVSSDRAAMCLILKVIYM